MEVQILKRRFTQEEYQRMAEAGILSEDDRVELIEGEIVQMTPIGRRHAACVARLTHLFSTVVEGRAIVWVQNPILLTPDSEPQPDVVLLRPRADFYKEADARPNDVLLLVEVADASAGYDRTVKLPLYARAGVREVWLVDLQGESVEVHRQPAASGYQDVRQLQRGGSVTAEAFPDLRFSASDILG